MSLPPALGDARNADGSVNNAGNPIARNGVITFYLTGAGQTNPAGIDGKPASEPLPKPVAPVTVTIGGVAAEVRYAGGAPGVIAGVMQVNAVVPDRVFGTVPVVVSVGGVPSQSGVTLVVR